MIDENVTPSFFLSTNYLRQILDCSRTAEKELLRPTHAVVCCAAGEESVGNAKGRG